MKFLCEGNFQHDSRNDAVFGGCHCEFDAGFFEYCFVTWLDIMGEMAFVTKPTIFPEMHEAIEYTT